jgi:hypothetical protein
MSRSFLRSCCVLILALPVLAPSALHAQDASTATTQAAEPPVASTQETSVAPSQTGQVAVPPPAPPSTIPPSSATPRTTGPRQPTIIPGKHVQPHEVRPGTYGSRPHQAGSSRSGNSDAAPAGPVLPERWFIEAGMALGPRIQDTFTHRLEDAGHGDKNGSNVRPELALGFAVHRLLTLIARYDMLGINQYQLYKWHTQSVSSGLRISHAFSAWMSVFAEVDLGLAISRITTKETPTSDAVYTQKLGPMQRLAGGFTVNGKYVGAYIAVHYTHATAVSDFGAVRNDGSPGVSLGLRARGLSW